jgi:hypothetical protein
MANELAEPLDDLDLHGDLDWYMCEYNIEGRDLNLKGWDFDF